MPQNTTCPLCPLEAASRRVDDDVDARRLACPRCGTFEMSGPLLATASTIAPTERARLSCCTRQRSAAGEIVRLLTSNWEGLAVPYGRTGLQAQRRRILEAVAHGVKQRPGRAHRLPSALDYPLFDCLDVSEFAWLQSSLTADGLLTRSGDDFQLTMKGWEAVSPVGGGGTPGLGFVAMSFDPSLDPAFDNGIKAAIEADCGLAAYRVDRSHHNEKIDDHILAGIRRAQFVVADFTLQRPGVYFEAGFGLALGRIVIWTCRDDDFGNLHFDTRQYNHIKWSTPEDLRGKLADRIRATVQLQARS
jgi:hypothetical protein